MNIWDIYLKNIYILKLQELNFFHVKSSTIKPVPLIRDKC